jgi:hypothetical protein
VRGPNYGIALAAALAAAALLWLALAGDAGAHYVPGPHNAVHAIEDAFPRPFERQAVDVAFCEGGEYYWLRVKRPWEATNGQYKSIFQMGENERRAYGRQPHPPYHGNNVWDHAEAAYRYFRASGFDWSPWSCKPWPSTYYNPMPRWLWAPVLLN